VCLIKWINLNIVPLMDLKYELLEHPSYSPDHPICSDFHLFPNLKKFVADKRFGSNEEVIAAVNGYFADLPESHFRNDPVIEETLDKVY